MRGSRLSITACYDRLHEELSKAGAKGLAAGGPIRTIDAQVMDLADEIAYAAHDLEDCLAAGLFDVEELAHEFRISGRDKPGGKDDFSEATKKLKCEVDESRKFAAKAERLKSSEEYAFLFRKELTSRLVNRLISDIGVVNTGSSDGLEGAGEDVVAALGRADGGREGHAVVAPAVARLESFFRLGLPVAPEGVRDRPGQDGGPTGGRGLRAPALPAAPLAELCAVPCVSFRGVALGWGVLAGSAGRKVSCNNNGEEPL